MKESKGFNAATGTSSEGYSHGANKFAGNHHTKTNPDALINKGRGPTGGGTKMPADKDMIMGSHNPQVRTPGGTRAFDPSAKQNYKGNADSINVGRGPTKGNQQ